ncbi:hypothetical protein [Gryllotalpicola protaetiae]|uniref:Uncharacterized protein n=1 Tax=Gryllotalpicola protaetiae TaxID=2419771 RepID=A0A387BS44_9MICO|nr:hypothetical protein [Gryllotalpicola protaetiae]AYG05528.1 hypothetical protein D7I44_17775 [Gryllotalpicola protaetiae]
MSFMYSTDGRSRWPWVIGALVLAVLIAAAIVWGTSRSAGGKPTASGTPTATSTPTPTDTTDSGASDGEAGAAPTGCLGGPNYDAASVLTAQKDAPNTDFGAVEVAAAFDRFTAQYPYPSTSAQQEVSAALRSSSSPSSYWEPYTEQSVGNNPTQGTLPAGTHFTVSTVNGLWRVQDGGNGELIVDMAAGYVVNGSLSPTKGNVSGFYMKWEKGAWRIVEGHNVDQNSLAAGGTHFTAGC